MFKKILFPLVALFMLAGCAKPPTTIEVSPTITLPQAGIPSLMGITVSINGADQRTDQALAKVTRDNQIVTLTASRDLRFLLQEVLEKQMTARGYMVGPNGPVDLQIIVSQLYADVSQGNVRYNIATKADIAIIATAQNGNKMTKNYRASYNVEGAFQASNKNIADAVNSVLTDTIADMSRDTSVHRIHQAERALISALWPGPLGLFIAISINITYFATLGHLLISGFCFRAPLALTSGTLQAWMTVGEYDLKTIGFFLYCLVGQAYVFKFLWSPLMDRYTPPFFGRRRGWLLATQILLLVAIAAMGFLEPGTQLRWMAALAVVIAFCSASQDMSSMRGKPMCSRQKNVVRARQSAFWVTV